MLDDSFDSLDRFPDHQFVKILHAAMTGMVKSDQTIRDTLTPDEWDAAIELMAELDQAMGDCNEC